MLGQSRGLIGLLDRRALIHNDTSVLVICARRRSRYYLLRCCHWTAKSHFTVDKLYKNEQSFVGQLFGQTENIVNYLSSIRLILLPHAINQIFDRVLTVYALPD